MNTLTASAKSRQQKDTRGAVVQCGRQTGQIITVPSHNLPGNPGAVPPLVEVTTKYDGLGVAEQASGTNFLGDMANTPSPSAFVTGAASRRTAVELGGGSNLKGGR